MAEQGIEGGRDSRHRTKLLDQIVAGADRLLTMDRIAMFIDHQFGAQVAAVGTEGSHLPRRKTAAQILNEGVER
ncbi:hypothetical protein [Sphingomonas sp. Ant H11]|uniref:hypothetical protein n=1 Tax=Sphingomonas sp. Ant H11 TaxID=1564113 RepID=UPI002F3F26AB